MKILLPLLACSLWITVSTFGQYSGKPGPGKKLQGSIGQPYKPQFNAGKEGFNSWEKDNEKDFSNILNSGEDNFFAIPVFTACPTDIIVNVPSNACANAVANYTVSATATPAPVLTHSFSGATVKNTANGTGSGSTFNKGVTTVTVTATNSFGNVKCIFTVSVTDVTPPLLSCAANVTINNTPGLCTGATTLIQPTASDNCSTPKLGNSLVFDGVNDYVVNAAYSNDFSGGKMTVEAWVYFNENTNWASIAKNWGHTQSGTYHFGLEGLTQKLQIQITQSNGSQVSVSAPSVISLNEWHHVAFVTDGTRLRLYQDGAEVGSASYNGTLKTSFNYTTFGAKRGDNGTMDASNVAPGYLNGRLDELRIWRVARTLTELRANMYSEIGAQQPSMVRLFHFNQGNAGGPNSGLTSLTDQSGYNNHGGLNNFALTGGSSNWVTGKPLGLVVSNNAPALFPIGNTVVTWKAMDEAGNFTTCNQTVSVLSPEINLQGNGANITDGSTLTSVANHTQFQSVNLGQQTARKFTIQNTGTANLTLAAGSITLTGMHAVSYTLSGITLPITLTPGGSTTFDISFTPTSAVQKAQVNIQSNDCDEAVFDFAINGTGLDAVAPVMVCGPDTTLLNRPGVCMGNGFITPVSVNENSKSGFFGTAIGFDGQNDNATKANPTGFNFNSTGEITAETWINVTPNQFNVWLSLTFQADNLIFRFGSDPEGRPFWNMGQHVDRTFYGFKFKPNTWYHVAFTGKKIGETIHTQIFVNGFPITMFNEGISTFPIIDRMYFGSGENGNVHHFNGKMDELRIWNTARTEEQIRANMNKELYTQGSGLVALYHFNEGIENGNNTTLTNANDSSGNGNHALLSNFNKTGTNSNWVNGRSFNLTNNAPIGFPVGITPVLWTATDGSNNTTTCTQNVTVVTPTGTIVKSRNNITIADGDFTPSLIDSTNFGNVGTPAASAIRNYTIHNPSPVPLVISHINLTGTDANLFKVQNISLPDTILPNESASFSLLLDPQSLGIKNAMVNIITNNCNVLSYDFSVSGMGVPAQTNMFTSSGTFTPLPGITNIVVEAWGAGGSNGGVNNPDGGGGGAYTKSKLLAVSPGVNYSFTIGQNSGNPSRNTVFNTLITANGAIGKTGGTTSSGSSIALSYNGGNGGIIGYNATSGAGGGGGGAGGSSGPGGIGGNSASINSPGTAGIAGTGGGNGGAGGKVISLNNYQPGGDGGSPGGGAGSYGTAKGANGGLKISYTCPNGGIIGNAHSVPYPPQLLYDSVVNILAEVPTPQNGLVYRWEQSTNNMQTWVPAKTPTNGLGYRFDRDSISVPTHYRRVSNACGGDSASNVIFINVVNPINGKIEGAVRSKNGSPVKDIKVYAQKMVGLPGSPATWIDSAITGIDGKYLIEKVYYGDPSEGNNNGSVSSKFIIWPKKPNHGFNPESLEKTLSNTNNSLVGIDFADSTVFAITGRTYQECIGCLNEANQPATITGPLDSVEMYRDGLFATKSGYSDPPAEFGRYTVTVSDPGTYKVQAKFKTHGFVPEFTNVFVAGDVNNIDFKDTSSYTISGKLTAGCNDYIGTAILEFYDSLPKDGNGNPRPSQFRKRVTTTAGTGEYSIKLPARVYKVKIISFVPKPGGDVQEIDLIDFFDNHIPKDSLVKDITLGNDSLNIVYNRPPTLTISGFEPICTSPQPIVLVQQGLPKLITIKAFQGPASKNCPAIDTNLVINTNIQDDEGEPIIMKTLNGDTVLTLIGGDPNIFSPFTKQFNVSFKDVNGFVTQKTVENIVVTGIKRTTGSFVTVSPEIPLMVLHDPPGDASSSFWESSKTNETAMRFYSAKSNSKEVWGEVKLGVKFEAGVAFGGYFSTETTIWGSVKGSMTVGERRNNAIESIVSNTTTTNFSTADNEEVVGSQGDVFIGAALNLKYSTADELVYHAEVCSLSVEKTLSFANDGFATEYIYSEDHIRNTLIPELIGFRDDASNTPEQTRNFANQVAVWEQTLANNDANKKRAVFDKNVSFSGSVGPIISTTTTSSSKSSTIEFDMEIDKVVAAELGLEIGGAGIKGGVTVGFKMETGNSETNNTLISNTIGYTLDDDDNEDFYSIDIKKDPVYNTPVFEMVGGRTSCPYEPGSQARIDMQLIAAEPVKTGIPPDAEAQFILKLRNTSQSPGERNYLVSLVQTSNTNGAIVTIGGSPAISPVPISIERGGEVPIIITVKKSVASNIFSYEGLQFKATDDCGGSIEKTIRISAFFTPTCSPIKLVQPEGGWVNNVSDNNILPVLFNGYNVANTSSVTLQYQKSGANSWIDGFTKTAAELSTVGNGTQVNWNVAALDDGGYNLRMKLNCPTGVVNSERSSGIIDRAAPIMLAKPEPTDDEFLRGDAISIQYNEALDCSGVTPSDVEVRRMSNNQLMEVNVGCFQNQIVIVPLTDISTFTADSIRVSVKNISDAYGNGKTEADSWRFLVGNSVPATGNKVLSLNSIGSTPGFAGKAGLTSTASVQEDGGVPIKFVFELPVNTSNDMLINYVVSGNAVYLKDFYIDYSQSQNLATEFNGASGSLTLQKNTRKVELSVIPIPNLQFEPDKTITITLVEGGDYLLGTKTTATGIILNDDTPKIYTFTGSGNYNVAANWDNNMVPASPILIGDEVVIDPAEGGECILNVPVTVQPGAKFTVMPGKVLKINSTLQVKKKL